MKTNRVVEIIFTVLGILMFGLNTVGSLIIYLNLDNPESKSIIEDIIIEGNIQEVTADQLFSFLSNGALFILVMTALCAILGIVSLFALIGDRKPKLAGTILIITAILGTILTLLTGILGGILYLIGGITALVRKSKANNSNNLTEDFR